MSGGFRARLRPMRGRRTDGRLSGAAALAVACAVLGLVSCQRCSQPAKPQSTGPSEAWLAGRLPPDAWTGAPRDGGTLTLRVPNEPAGLTRIHDTQRDAFMPRYTVGVVVEALAQVDPAQPDGPLLPALATAWELGGDTLTVHLRAGVRFHDGAPLTAADVKACFDLVLDPAAPTAITRAAVDAVTRVAAPDEQTVVFTLSRPNVFTTRAVLTSVPILPARLLGPPFADSPVHRAPVGTGPFRFDAWAEGQQLSFVRFDGYWGPRPYLDRIVVRFIKDEVVALQALERGEVDLVPRVSAQVWRSLEQPGNAWAQQRVHRVLAPEVGYSYLVWNVARRPFDDARVREALAAAYPADAMARLVELGLEQRTTCPYPPESRGCDPTVRPPATDLAKARALLDAAGVVDGDGDGVREVDGAPFRPRFVMPAGSPRAQKFFPVLEEAFARLGVALVAEPVEPAVFLARLRAHDFDVAPMALAGQDGAVDALPVFHSSQADGGLNYGGFGDPALDRLLEEARAAADDAERVRLEREIHRRVAQTQPVLFLTTRPSLDLIARRVHGLAPSSAWYALARAWVEAPAR